MPMEGCVFGFFFKVNNPFNFFHNFCLADFRCKDRRSCVSQSLVCDGRSHCHDGSDEVNCQSVTPPAVQTNILKCRMGSRLCRDGKECVLYSHVCDGERDCRDGSDEEGCGECSYNSCIFKDNKWKSAF